MQATLTTAAPRGSSIAEPGVSLLPSAAPSSARTAPWIAWLVPSFGQLLFLGIVVATLLKGSLMVSADSDPFRHIAVGELILNTGAIPDADVFSHTMAGTHFVPYEWLAEIASALSVRLAGLAGPVLLHGAVIAVAFALLFAHLRHLGHGVLLSLAVTTGAGVTSAVHWLARPHVFTFLGVAVFATVLDSWFRAQRSRHALWLLPATMLVWVNAHGGFLVGLILLGAYVVVDALRSTLGDAGVAAAARTRLAQLVPPTLAAVAAVLVNPAGVEIIPHVTGYFANRLLVDRTSEYLSPDFHAPDAAPFLVAVLGLLVCLGWSRRRPALHEMALISAFTFFALHSARNIPLFAIVVAPILARQLASIVVEAAGAPANRVVQTFRAWFLARDAAYDRIDRRARGAAVSVVVVGALALVSAQQLAAGVSPLGVEPLQTRQPVAAVSYVKQHPPTGRMFNELRWGGYLLHELWPHHQVFIDGQTDFYGEALTKDWLTVVELQDGWQQVLDRYDVDWVIYPTDSALTRALAAAGWRTAYVDSVATVLTR